MKMDERQLEQLSAISDGEASFDDAMLKAVASNPEFQDQWSRIHLVRDAIRGHQVSREVLNISQRVSQALQDEPTVLAPRKRFSREQIMKQAGGVAIAATIAVAAVLTVQQQGPSEKGQPMTVASVPVMTSSPESGNIRNVTANVSHPAEQPRVSTAIERKLSNYIVNHNEYSATSNMQGMLPYVRIVGYVPTRQVANEK
jgi:sigma-E factor negative regulatory protein RseA